MTLLRVWLAAAELMTTSLRDLVQRSCNNAISLVVNQNHQKSNNYNSFELEFQLTLLPGPRRRVDDVAQWKLVLDHVTVYTVELERASASKLWWRFPKLIIPGAYI